jgi:hypothetical protein
VVVRQVVCGQVNQLPQPPLLCFLVGAQWAVVALCQQPECLVTGQIRQEAAIRRLPLPALEMRQQRLLLRLRQQLKTLPVCSCCAAWRYLLTSWKGRLLGLGEPAASCFQF